MNYNNMVQFYFMQQFMQDLIARRTSIQKMRKEDKYADAVSPIEIDDYLEAPTKSEGEGVIKEFIHLAFDAFVLGSTILLVSARGLGKTLFSIFLANSEHIKAPYFLALEDYSSWQRERYRQGLKNQNARFISRKNWDLFYEDILLNIELLTEKFATANTLMESDPLFVFNVQYQKNLRKVKYSFGVPEEKEKLDFLMVFLFFIDKIKGTADFLCVDTLLAMQQGKTFTRKDLERLIRPASDAGITLLLLHHTNKKGDVHGVSEIQNAVDEVVKLSFFGKDDDDNDVLRLNVEKSRFCEPSCSLIVKKWSESNLHVAEFEKVEDFHPEAKTSSSMKSDAWKILSSGSFGTISKEDLAEELSKVMGKECNMGSLKNTLKALENDELIKKADGKTWENIEIC